MFCACRLVILQLPRHNSQIFTQSRVLQQAEGVRLAKGKTVKSFLSNVHDVRPPHGLCAVHLHRNRWKQGGRDPALSMAFDDHWAGQSLLGKVIGNAERLANLENDLHRQSTWRQHAGSPIDSIPSRAILHRSSVGCVSKSCYQLNAVVASTTSHTPPQRRLLWTSEAIKICWSLKFSHCCELRHKAIVAQPEVSLAILLAHLAKPNGTRKPIDAEVREDGVNALHQTCRTRPARDEMDVHADPILANPAGSFMKSHILKASPIAKLGAALHPSPHADPLAFSLNIARGKCFWTMEILEGRICLTPKQHLTNFFTDWPFVWRSAH
mmetsp:Transcript_28023/g.65108  ORF Transcript_28023/g.65108 Transcript_28023/m.65108 type:complete len:325 (+) Transcript_28023:1902-2876(+)